MVQSLKIQVVILNRNTMQRYVCDSLQVQCRDRVIDLEELLQTPFVSIFFSTGFKIFLLVNAAQNYPASFIGEYPRVNPSVRFLPEDSLTTEDGIGNGSIQIEFEPYYSNQSPSREEDSSIHSLEESNPRVNSICSFDQPEQDLEEGDTRDLEKTVTEALRLVKLWRDTYNEANKRLAKGFLIISLNVVARELRVCKKKTLDYYFYQLRFAEQLGFSIRDNLKSKMGVVRKFNTQNMFEGSKRCNVMKSKDIVYQLDPSQVMSVDEEVIERLLQNAKHRKTRSLNTFFDHQQGKSKKSQKRQVQNISTFATAKEEKIEEEESNFILKPAQNKFVLSTSTIASPSFNGEAHQQPTENVTATSQTIQNEYQLSQMKTPFVIPARDFECFFPRLDVDAFNSNNLSIREQVQPISQNRLFYQDEERDMPQIFFESFIDFQDEHRFTPTDEGSYFY